MKTECTGTLFDFQPLEKREVVASFDGGTLTSDAGGLLLREVEQRCGILRQFSGCFRDLRDAERIEHTVAELVAQRVYAIALGYEDLNDHEALRNDPVLAVVHLLRGALVVFAIAGVEPGCVGGECGGGGADRGAGPSELAERRDCDSGGCGILPGIADELV